MSDFADISWLENIDTAHRMNTVLLEYRYLVRRFPQWLLLVAGRCEHEYIRKLLLPNIVEECGSIGGALSHLELLDRCLLSVGLQSPEAYRPSAKTQRVESWFYRTFLKQDIYCCLCVLGPGTEAISSRFLLPLERGLKRLYEDTSIDLDYFEAHREEIEGGHAEALELAVEYCEKAVPSGNLVELRAKWTHMGRCAHSSFWENLERIACE